MTTFKKTIGNVELGILYPANVKEESNPILKISNIQFNENILTIYIDNNSAYEVDLSAHSWLSWLHYASPEQRKKWNIEPAGYAVYWDELDDGLELEHLPEFAKKISK